MNQPATPDALAEATVPRRPVRIEHILTVVDELANISTPTPGSTIVRFGLLTEIRNALTPSLGSSGSGRGGGRRIPLDVDAIRVWESSIDRVKALTLDLDPDAPIHRAGSLEQLLNAWARDLVAADVDARTRQDIAGTDPTGLNQDALRLMLHRVTRIRDQINHYLNPSPHGDIPGAQCPVCEQTTVLVDEDGEDVQMPALGFHKPATGLVVECRNPECLATWRGIDELRVLERQVVIFRTFFAGRTTTPIHTTKD